MEELEGLGAVLALKGNYHNHKETMAHAAVAIQIGILIAIINIEKLPVWLKCSDQKWLFFKIYFVIWLMITLYMCWQLRNRWIAAKQVDILIKDIERNVKDLQTKKVIACMRGKGWLWIGQGIVLIVDLIVLVIIFLKVKFLW